MPASKGKTINRGQGRRALMDEIRRRGPMPRIALAERTGISRATVTTTTANLIELGLIEEVAPDDSTTSQGRGRPRVDLRIKADAHLVAGVKIANQSLSLVLMNFAFDQVADLDVPLPAPCLSASEMITQIGQAVDALTAKAGLSRADLSGIGVGIAGIVQAERGVVLWSPSLDSDNINLGREASTALGLPVFIDNDANLVAVAELGFGLGRENSDFIVITVESGVGMGLVIDGRLYRGAGGCGAEFGHTKIQPDGLKCRCGQNGCLEAYVADYALIDAARGLVGFDGSLSDRDQIAALVARAEHDPDARSILDRAVSHFALSLANIVNIFDPTLIILAGGQMTSNHLIGQDVVERMKSSIVQVDKPAPAVNVHNWGDLMWALGGAAHAIDRVLDTVLDGLTDHD